MLASLMRSSWGALDVLARSSWGLTGDDASAVAIVLLVLGLVALAGAVWRAFARDAIGAVLLLLVGVVLLVLAL